MLQPVNEKSARIDIRTSQNAKVLLQEAAAATHKSVTDFLLEHGLKAAEQVLADQCVFMLNSEQWKLFSEALDRPVQRKQNLKKLLTEPSVFEK